MKQVLIPLLDNGHGFNTLGKRSPRWADGSVLFEYEFNREITALIAKMLEERNIIYQNICPELIDVPLSVRVDRANKLFREMKGACFVISVHANAGGGTGWEAWTSVGQTKSDKIADILYEEAAKEFPEKRMRKDSSDGDPDKESQFYILAKTVCPAVLTENFFFDNESECKWMMLDETKLRIARFHVKAIERIIGGL